MSNPLVTRIKEANTVILVEGNLKAIPDFFASEYVSHITENDLTGGHDAVRKIVDRWLRAFHDLSVEVEILVEGSERTAWCRTIRAVHNGDYMGFPATGKKIVWRDMITSRFHDNLFVEDWIVTDLAERLLLARKQ